MLHRCDVVMKPIISDDLITIIKQAKVTAYVQKITSKDLSSVNTELNETDFTKWIGYNSTPFSN